ncbi:MAG: hypothetical protein CMJ85_05660 [Planctomycetes bacterium]|nr:hypothetical protein [Planctomycetota bacterium]
MSRGTCDGQACLRLRADEPLLLEELKTKDPIPKKAIDLLRWRANVVRGPIRQRVACSHNTVLIGNTAVPCARSANDVVTIRTIVARMKQQGQDDS